MKKNSLVRSLKTQAEAGLTLVEVIVAMLVASLCLGTALQGYVAAVSVKARTKQLSIAIDKINADAETIRQTAQIPTYETPQKLKIKCDGNYAQALMDQVVEQDKVKQDEADQNTVAQTTPVQNQGGAKLEQQSNDPDYNQSGNAAGTSGTASSTSASSAATPEKTATSTSIPPASDEPVASSLDDTGDGPTQPEPYLIASKDLPSSYKLKREMNVDPNTPKVLKVSYHLTRSAESPATPSDSPTPAASAGETTDKPVTLAQLSLSVMPSDALRCP